MSAVRRVRLDQELVRRGLVPTRSRAREAILAGRVTVDGAPGTKPGSLVSPAQRVTLTEVGGRWVSRGGDKLDGALSRFNIRIGGRVCLDAGAATGGFTDVLLAHGAARVIAVDVGYGQLAWSLRQDPRVVVRERTNVRHLSPEDVGGDRPQVVTADLSFIGLGVVLPALCAVAAVDADFVLLVKPQFEAGREFVEKGGVVRDPRGWRAALESVEAAAQGQDLGVAGAVVSPLRGPAGNTEFFVWLQEADGRSGDWIAQVLDEAARLDG